MKLLKTMMVLAGISVTGVFAQKLETQPPDTKKVTLVETARDHLTVIELGDPVTMVAVGNQNAFTIERRENKVFVKPVEDGARTNLFIWTSAGRFSYELLPAETVQEMHFAIDQTPAPIAAVVPQPAEEVVARKAPALPTEMLTKAKPILLAGDQDTQGRVEVALRDLYRDGNRLFVRYALINHTRHDYETARPEVWRLAGVHSAQSLIPLGDQQLGDRLSRTLRARGSSPVEVLDANQVAQLAPGGQGLGWLVIEDPEGSVHETAVLRLGFAADAKGRVDAVLVLQPHGGIREVASAGPSGN